MPQPLGSRPRATGPCDAPVVCSLSSLGTAWRYVPPSPPPSFSLAPGGLRHLQDSSFSWRTPASSVLSPPRCPSFRLGEAGSWILDRSPSSFATSSVSWLYILANSRYPTNVCSMNELQVKGVSWKYCDSKLAKVILKLLQKGTRAIPSGNAILLGKDLLGPVRHP